MVAAVLLAAGVLVVLVVVMLPVFNGIGSYKKKILMDNPQLAAREERRKELREQKKRRQAEDATGAYRPASWDKEEEEEPSSSFASALRDRTMNGGVRFSPKIDSETRTQNDSIGQYVDPTKPRSSHIDNNFDYDKFIREQEDADSKDAHFAKNLEDVA